VSSHSTNECGYFGNSKSIQELELDEALRRKIAAACDFLAPFPAEILEPLQACISRTTASRLQARWNRRLRNDTHPYDIVDEAGRTVEKAIFWIREHQIPAKKILCDLFQERADTSGLPKILKVSEAVIAGCRVGCAANAILASPHFNQTDEFSAP
jgi:hypothetical protein